MEEFNETFPDETVMRAEYGGQCPESYHQEEKFVSDTAWWLEGVVEIIIGVTGFTANCLAIPILCSRAMSSIFNRLLVGLTVFDNVFLFCSVLESVRKYVGATNIHQLIFIHFLYQVQNIALTASIYATVILAVERYLAISRPIEYHLSVNASGASPWKRVAAYLVPISLFALAFNFPRFFELKTVYTPVLKTETGDFVEIVYENDQNETLEIYDDIEFKVDFAATDLRMDENYVFYYINLARLLVTGIVPFAALIWLNYSIYSHMKRHRINQAVLHRNATAPKTAEGSHSPKTNETNLTTSVSVKGNGHTSAPSSTVTSQHQTEENRQALVLVFIVFMFLICNVPRIILNCYEVFITPSMKEDMGKPCYQLPTWIHLTTFISLILMTINSSTNFFIYCMVNATFRKEFFKWVNKARFRGEPSVRYAHTTRA